VSAQAEMINDIKITKIDLGTDDILTNDRLFIVSSLLI